MTYERDGNGITITDSDGDSVDIDLSYLGGQLVVYVERVSNSGCNIEGDDLEKLLKRMAKVARKAKAEA